MEPPMLTHKRSLSDSHDDEPPPKTKKCLLLDTEQTDKTTDIATQQKSYTEPSTSLDCVSANDLTDTQNLSQLISFWSDTPCVGKKVLLYLKSRQAIEDILLSNSVNKKFLEFHHDITEECGAEDKQHSWAVIEKKEEVVMYGPYYPNYNKGEHSEDIIISQTQEMLESTGATEDWNVYVFTMNSPCLARNVGPCMLKLVQKAQEWWLRFKVKTHVGYKRCWGFKGTKETMFRVVNYSQVKAVDQSQNYEEYVIQRQTSINLLCENVYSVLKDLLKSRPQRFALSLHGLEWKSYFKGMQSISECAQENDKEVLTQVLSKMTEAVQSLSTEENMSFEDYLQRGQAFSLDYSFNSQIHEVIKDQMRLAFQSCWRDLLQAKYAEFIRDTLTEDFNKCTNQLFIKDFVKMTTQFLQIGRITFSYQTS